MIKLFYQDKVIIFETNNNRYPEKDLIFEDKPVVDQILCVLKERAELIIVSENEDSAFAHFTRGFKPVTAAGGMVRNVKDEILMIYRNERWDLPKGKLEEGESLDQCAVREVMEETGIDGISTLGMPLVTQHIYNIYGGWELKTTYWYKMVYDEDNDRRKDYNFVPQEIEGITKCEWLSATKVKIVTHHSYATIKYVVDEFFKN